MPFHHLCLLHPCDPRADDADVVVRRLAAVVASRPDDFSLLWVGIDARGDLEPGRVVPLDVAGRPFDFLPVAGPGGPAFAVGALRRLKTIRAAATAERVSIAVHDVVWTPLARLLLRPVVLVVHDDPRRDEADRPSLTAVARERLALRLADRIVGFDPGFVRRCRDCGPDIAAKTELLSLTGHDGAGRPPSLAADETALVRLWERHRRFYDVHPARHGRHVAA